ncbi:SCA7-domain-containing protein [Gigaspora margarita]|uniref:SCA7-domain-containing protein n=1 Tax=Gigaspora margarita TaxID=4874 RepID=A0A8H4A8R3_GIGMA|nr:SCA7-domain-containing protein [Gigaspora margarita]
MNPNWKSLLSHASISLFKDELTEPLQTPLVTSREVPLEAYSSWSDLKEAILDEDEYEEDVVLTSQDVNVPPSILSRFKYDDMKTYGCKPAREESGVIQCNACSKKLFSSGFVEHTENCEKIKAMSSTSTRKIPINEIPVNKNTKYIESITNSYVSNKKRKRSVTSEAELTERSISTKASTSISDTRSSPVKKQQIKKEKEKKTKLTKRNKGPIDLDRQCGVIEHTGTQCSRSLTCKSHSMALKRAVQGRSQPFNTLLSQYPKKSIGRPQNNGVPDNKSENIKKEGSTVEVDEKDDGVVDSDEEVDAVMEAIMCSKPQPLVTRPESYVPSTIAKSIQNHMTELAEIDETD